MKVEDILRLFKYADPQAEVIFHDQFSNVDFPVNRAIERNRSDNKIVILTNANNAIKTLGNEID